MSVTKIKRLIGLVPSLCLLWAAGAVAQTEILLVGNSSQPNSERREANFQGSVDHAQQFTTGSSTTGYTLTKVEFLSKDSASHTFSAQLCEANNTGGGAVPNPTNCRALNTTSSFAQDTTVVFTPPSDQTITLAASTHYVVVLSENNSPSVQVTIASTQADNQAGATGWTLANVFDWKQSGTTWTKQNSGRDALLMDVKGYVTPPDTTPPSPSISEVAPTGVQVSLVFNEALDITVGSLSAAVLAAFTLTVDGVDREIESVSAVSGRTLRFQLPSAAAIYQNQTVTLSYNKTAAGTDALEDAASNDVASFTDRPVTNQSTLVNSAPTVATAILDQMATVGTSFSYQFPADTFSDVDTLTYTAVLADGTALPPLAALHRQHAHLLGHAAGLGHGNGVGGGDRQRQRRRGGQRHLRHHGHEGDGHSTYAHKCNGGRRLEGRQNQPRVR